MANLGYHELRSKYKCCQYYYAQGFYTEVYDTPDIIYACDFTENSGELPLTIRIGHKVMPKSFEKTTLALIGQIKS